MTTGETSSATDRPQLAFALRLQHAGRSAEAETAFAAHLAAHPPECEGSLSDVIQFVRFLPGGRARVREAALVADGYWAPLAPRITDFSAEIRDFGDTAAIIDELDLVISVDTAVAHVAGAMGKPVWMLDRYHTSWRWRLSAERSPWYPSLRIFRQHRFLDWSRPLSAIEAALGRFVADGTSPS